MKDIGAEWSDEVKGVGFEGGDLGNVMEGVPIDEFFLRYPKFFSVVVDNVVLVRVPVFDEGTGGGGKEVRK